MRRPPSRQYRANDLLCVPEEVTADGSFTCIVRRGPGKMDYRVRVTPKYAVECPFCHYEGLIRPCSHVIAAMNVASMLVGLPQYQNVIDQRWLRTVLHLETWRAQRSGLIKRVSLAGHAAQLKQEDIIAPKMHARPDRKRKKPYEPSQTMPRK